MPSGPKRFVYIICSVRAPERRYVGVTADLAARLEAHNAGQNRSTAPWRPWALDICIEFRSEALAMRFEKYLKSGAGHAFAKRHFGDSDPRGPERAEGKGRVLQGGPLGPSADE